MFFAGDFLYKQSCTREYLQLSAKKKKDQTENKEKKATQKHHLQQEYKSQS